jgi:hypothetical protein
VLLGVWHGVICACMGIGERDLSPCPPRSDSGCFEWCLCRSMSGSRCANSRTMMCVVYGVFQDRRVGEREEAPTQGAQRVKPGELFRAI